MEQEDLLRLEHRMGKAHLSRRLRQQVNMSGTLFGEGRGRYHWENLRLTPKVLRTGLKALGLLRRGIRNTLDFRVEEETFSFPDLPRAFDGFTILHLSDLHIDGMVDEGERLAEIVRPLDFDLAVLTGDFRFLTVHDYGETLRRMPPLADALTRRDGIVGVLGNHDFIEKVPGFERLGISILLNEALEVRRGPDSLRLVGLDDPHFYGTHDFSRAFSGLPPGEFKILLAHSPEVIPEAAAFGTRLYLCGHTHGGQICLPGRIPILTNCSAPRRYLSGRWHYGGMCGYTSRGTGTSTFPVRYFCPPEITLHRLRRSP
ncbi:MAG: metallophosphoesterase [Desulfuromonas sp.]|uniref:metallophosphoesterase n=1 Tax=Desulfuromonas sp. TaxID=892 RepID=UPI000CB46999|nr:metallophosphoesterase [Desulfuromonas sp.]PLX82383.1 MAG: metallophosphoesterase [Desulfuromonas sp.]